MACNRSNLSYTSLRISGNDQDYPLPWSTGLPMFHPLWSVFISHYRKPWSKKTSCQVKITASFCNKHIPRGTHRFHRVLSPFILSVCNAEPKMEAFNLDAEIWLSSRGHCIICIVSHLRPPGWKLWWQSRQLIWRYCSKQWHLFMKEQFQRQIVLRKTQD